MRIVKSILIVAATLSLVGCAGHIRTDKLQKLHAGMTHKQASEVVIHSPLETFDMIIRGHKVNMEVYKEKDMAYFIAYQHHRLLFWGFESDYAGSHNALIRAIGRRATTDWEALRQ